MRKRWFLIGMLLLLFALGIFIVIYSSIHPELDIMGYLAGSATFVIALLTVTYVYITSKQLDVMDAQLKQIMIDREYQSQPLPWIFGIEFTLAKPRLYYTPPENNYEVLSRYFVYFKVRNIGACPAVCIDVLGRVVVPVGDSKMDLYATAIGIPTLEEKEEYPSKTKKENFLFPSDHDGFVLEALREEDLRKYPLIECQVVYRNIMRGCFVLQNRYRVYLEKNMQDRILSNWLTIIKSFDVKYKKELDVLRELREKDIDKWNEKFDLLKEKIDKDVIGKDIKMIPWPIPGSFNVFAVSKEEYERVTEDISYGVRIGKGSKCWAVETK